MYEVRFHGRGGQGAVTAASILAIAAFKDGYDVQSFPHFGVERRGAPVMAFTRLDDKKIEIKTQVYSPDCVIVLDTNLLATVDVCKGIKKGGTIILNSVKDPADFADMAKRIGGGRIATVDATSIALRHGLGSKTAPIVNTAILGAYAKVVGNVSLESIVDTVRAEAPAKKEENAKAVEDAYNEVKEEVFG
ncbi:MAG: pyruvate ferredoxin oxidoreductase [Thermoplasmata archaeon]|nr:MAG: pyruvate ferredoxin oxidoreductase [Thermoplasmata archaeon]